MVYALILEQGSDQITHLSNIIIVHRVCDFDRQVQSNKQEYQEFNHSSTKVVSHKRRAE